MPNQIDITPAYLEHRDAIISLLQSERLPVEDLPQDLRNFFAATDNGSVVAAIGLETYERDGLLRSLVVKPEFRSMKIAAGLISELEKLARNLGLYHIFLLTETAPEYFATKGYEKIDRDQAPESIKLSSEFSHVCPSSAILMKKKL